MDVFFVRHGETNSNYSGVHQSPHIPLSNSGLKQVHVLAERLGKIPFEVIISSTYLRATQTAEKINQKHGKNILYSDLFVELRRPSILQGKAFDDPEIQDLKQKLHQNLHNPDYHHSDEESFADLKNRAKSALDLIISQPSSLTLVVTHGQATILFLSYMIFGEDLDSYRYYRMLGAIHLDNTGITKCVYKDGSWWVINVNDVAHLQ